LDLLRAARKETVALEPFTFIPELGMLAELFPYDRRLPALPALTSSPSPDLERRLLASLDSGAWKIETRACEPVRYRAQLGAVRRYALQTRDMLTGEEREGRYYLKVYGDEETGERSYQALTTLCNGGGADQRLFAVSRPVAYWTDFRSLAQEEAP